MTKDEEEFYKTLITSPRSMQGDYAYLLKANGEEITMSPKIGENYGKEDIIKMIGEGFSKSLHGNCMMVYRNNLPENKSYYNTKASRLAKSPIYGDAIYAPSEFFNL